MIDDSQALPKGSMVLDSYSKYPSTMVRKHLGYDLFMCVLALTLWHCQDAMQARLVDLLHSIIQADVRTMGGMMT